MVKARVAVEITAFLLNLHLREARRQVVVGLRRRRRTMEVLQVMVLLVMQRERRPLNNPLKVLEARLQEMGHLAMVVKQVDMGIMASQTLVWEVQPILNNPPQPPHLALLLHQTVLRRVVLEIMELRGQRYQPEVETTEAQLPSHSIMAELPLPHRVPPLPFKHTSILHPADQEPRATAENRMGMELQILSNHLSLQINKRRQHILTLPLVHHQQPQPLHLAQEVPEFPLQTPSDPTSLLFSLRRHRMPAPETQGSRQA